MPTSSSFYLSLSPQKKLNLVENLRQFSLWPFRTKRELLGSSKWWFFWMLCFCVFHVEAQEYVLIEKGNLLGKSWIYKVIPQYEEELEQFNRKVIHTKNRDVQIVGYLRNYRNEPIPFSEVSLVVHRANSTWKTATTSDVNGFFKLNMSDSLAELVVTNHYGYNGFRKIITEPNPGIFEYILVLGRKSNEGNYLIGAKRKLSESQLKEAIKCIKSHAVFNNNKVYDCETQRYTISVEL